jgi:hypothetical protein
MTRSLIWPTVVYSRPTHGLIAGVKSILQPPRQLANLPIPFLKRK